MKVAVLGAGAMGCVFGGLLAEAGHDVTLIDVWRETVDVIAQRGVRVEDGNNTGRTVLVRATTNPAEAGLADLVLILVKSYDTVAAARSALPLLGENSIALSLQNGWGNSSRIADIVGKERVLAGVTYHSATTLGPGHVRHAGKGQTIVGELDDRISVRASQLAASFTEAGIEARATTTVLKEIWSKLSLNACTLPTAALLKFTASQLIEHEGTLELMRNLLRETVAVAKAQGIELVEEERWEAITSLLRRAAGAKASMLQDVERRRRTEIDVINGAVTHVGRRLGVPTPYNQAVLCLIESLEETFESQ